MRVQSCRLPLLLQDRLELELLFLLDKDGAAGQCARLRRIDPLYPILEAFCTTVLENAINVTPLSLFKCGRDVLTCHLNSALGLLLNGTDLAC